MKANYHTHTSRCGHAIGTEEEMIQAALASQFEVIGLSDHIPLLHLRAHLIESIPTSIHRFHDVLSIGKAFLYNGPGMRMPYRQKKDYLANIQRLKNKYQDQIQIYAGFEAEYIEEYLPYYKELLTSGEVDYLILGHHFHRFVTGSNYYARYPISKKMVNSYVEEAILAMQSGLFLYFAHPDIFLKGYGKWDEVAQAATKRLLEASKHYQFPLEVNGGGLRDCAYTFNQEKLQGYPNVYFWQEAKKMDVPIVLGLDAHAPDHLGKEAVTQLEKFAQEFALDITEKLNIQFYFDRLKK